MTADRNKHRAFANRGLALLTALLLLAPAARADSDRLYQVSSIDALLAGLYDGVAYVEEAITHGDFGLGTFDRLDGELILLDGEVFRAGADGKVVRMPADSRTLSSRLPISPPISNFRHRPASLMLSSSSGWSRGYRAPTWSMP